MPDRWIKMSFLLTILILSTSAIAEDVEGDVGTNASYDLVITNASFVATGPEDENLNEEWVEIENQGTAIQEMTGWTLADEANHEYNFPEGFTLAPHAKVKVHTGSGEDTTEALFMNYKRAIWNDDGDVATLLDGTGEIVSQFPAPV
ncbi:MAG: lamin tail domain-containing protein [Methanotrichaceae archaeon]|nr:lamin tail domain-containing protein [Methanotrichaceae archaeon]